MKKNKLFISLAVFGLLLTGLAACGEKPSGESQDTETPASEHTHKFGKWTVVTAATCAQEGLEERVCECGEKETRPIEKLPHTWDEGTVSKEAKCDDPGTKLFRCTKCDATKFEPYYVDHTFGEPFAMPGYTTASPYLKSECTTCTGDYHAYKLEIAAKDYLELSGSLKAESRFPDYIKLGTNGDSISLAFQYNAPATGKIYLRGVMDFWHDGSNNNKQKNFFSGKNSQDGNFELKVNDAVVDYSATKNLTYEDMLPGEAQSGNFSALGDCLVGEVTLKSGLNTLVYKRTESYNLLVKDFVIIVQNTGDIVEPAEINEGYKVNFTATNCSILVYKAGQAYEDDGVTPVAENPTYTTDKTGNICKWTEAREALDNCPQINIKVVCDEGYEIDSSCFDITGVVKNIKAIKTIAAENAVIYRLTKIHSDLTVKVAAKQAEVGAPDGYAITFALTNCTVKVYVGPKNETGSNVDTPDADGLYYTRDPKNEYAYTKDGTLKPRITFEIVPAEGFEFVDGITWGDPDDAGVVEASAKASWIDPSTGYKNLKKNPDGTMYLTSVSGPLTITIACTAVSE